MTIPRYPITLSGEITDVGTAAELVVALDVLQGQHDRLVLEQLRQHLAAVIGGPQGLFAVLRVLSADDQIYLIDSLGADLPRLVQRSATLRDMLATLAEPRVEERLLTTIGGDGLRALIGSAEELAEVLEWVYGDCDRLTLQLLGPAALTHLCLGGYELSLVLHALDRDRQAELLDMLGWEQVISLVQNRRDLAYLLRALPSQLSQELMSRLTEARLRSLVRDGRDWEYLSRYLEAAERDYLATRLGVQSHAE